jgi:protein-S-isoprenylcysteine O-methyltransferase Ste14
VWAVATLRKHGTTFMPDRTASVLVTTGPFMRFRNPIYLGDALLILGIAEITKSIWFVAAAFAFGVLVTVLQIVPEERHLESKFGDAYIDYKSRTRRWI